MKVGDTFSSFEEFNESLAKYKKLVDNEYWIRDARTIKNQQKRHPDTVINANDSIKYYYIVMACVRGGRKFQSKQPTPKQNSTVKQDCTAAIYVHMSKCHQLLIVTKINENHNHKPISATSKLSKRLLFLRKKKKLDHLYTSKTKFDSEKVKKQAKSKMKHLTKHDKYNIIEEQGKIMAQMCSGVSIPVFHERLNIIKNIIKEWNSSEFLIAGQDGNLAAELKAEPLDTDTTGTFKIRKLNKNNDNKSPKIVKREKILGNNVNGLELGKTNNNTMKKEHKEESLDEYLEEEYLEEDTFYIQKEEEGLDEYLDEEYLDDDQFSNSNETYGSAEDDEEGSSEELLEEEYIIS